MPDVPALAYARAISFPIPFPGPLTRTTKGVGSWTFVGSVEGQKVLW
jgi:hypothetical protein